MTSLALLMFTGLVVYVNGQTKYCCTPQQWESTNSIDSVKVDTQGTKKPVYTTGVEAVSVDQTGHRIASLSTLTTGGFKVNVQVIQLFDKGVMYTIQSGECTPTKIPAWQPNCIPDNATKTLSTYYGAGDNKINVDMYIVKSGPNNVTVVMSSADCTPMYVSAYGSLNGVSGLSDKVYKNITLGIKDVSVFTVPDICPNVTMHHDYVMPTGGWY
ncbi:hypothetical protein ACF0H5_000914 [Mactra antiquata]